jgi:hypothetical protein
MTPALLAALLAAAQPGSGYFSDALLTELGRCGDDAASKADLTKLLADHYAAHLQAAGEPVLGEIPPTTVRFLWLRSFDAPVTVAIVDNGSSLRLRARRLGGQGGYEPGAIVARIDRPLTPKEVASWRRMNEHIDPWRLPTATCEPNLDGAQWVIEAAGRKGRTIANWQSPTTGPVRELGLFMLGLTGWKLDPLY